MFNFLKPRRNPEEQCGAFAASALSLWMEPGPKTKLDISKLVEMGCDKDRLCGEMTAFTVFSFWYGLSLAYEQGKLKEPLYQRLENSFFAAVRSQTAGTPLPVEVSPLLRLVR